METKDENAGAGVRNDNIIFSGTARVPTHFQCVLYPGSGRKDCLQFIISNGRIHIITMIVIAATSSEFRHFSASISCV